MDPDCGSDTQFSVGVEGWPINRRAHQSKGSDDTNQQTIVNHGSHWETSAFKLDVNVSEPAVISLQPASLNSEGVLAHDLVDLGILPTPRQSEVLTIPTGRPFSTTTAAP